MTIDALQRYQTTAETRRATRAGACSRRHATRPRRPGKSAMLDMLDSRFALRLHPARRVGRSRPLAKHAPRARKPQPPHRVARRTLSTTRDDEGERVRALFATRGQGPSKFLVLEQSLVVHTVICATRQWTSISKTGVLRKSRHVDSGDAVKTQRRKRRGSTRRLDVSETRDYRRHVVSRAGIRMRRPPAVAQQLFSYCDQRCTAVDFPRPDMWLGGHHEYSCDTQARR